MTTATVRLWGTDVGYVSMDAEERFARFEFDPDFARMGVEVAPLMMPVQAGRIYRFPDLHPRSFYGLPGMLADSLPDKYGNRLIDIWLAKTGRSPESFNAVDRLCYAGRRGMGALEFEPAQPPGENKDKSLEVAQLVELAALAFAAKDTLQTQFPQGQGVDDADNEGLLDILSVGTSAGGARAKAVIAYQPETGEVRSGQLDLPQGYEHWLIKFDGVSFSGDWGVADPAGYGLVEYSYYDVARRCGIDMMESRLLCENGRSHFMTRRFDRGAAGEKYFVQTLGALAHYDYWESGAYSYEQVVMVMRQLGMPKAMLEQQVRRAVFNIVACNQDDHVKNISFTMDRAGQWSLSPAYDLCHSEGSDFTRNHQLSLNGKTNNFVREDIKHLAEYAGLPRGRDKQILEEVLQAFAQWPELAGELAIPERLRRHVQRTLRLDW